MVAILAPSSLGFVAPSVAAHDCKIVLTTLKLQYNIIVLGMDVPARVPIGTHTNTPVVAYHPTHEVTLLNLILHVQQPLNIFLCMG